MSQTPIKIPQNVYIEDRIVGPLTLKQVLIVAVGGGFSYALFALLSKTYGGLSLPVTVMVWIPCAISAVFAFVKINDLSMLRLIMLLLESINKPSQRVWSPRTGLTINIRTRVAASQIQAPQQQATSMQRTGTASRLDELSALLDLPDTQNSVEEMTQSDEIPSMESAPAPLQTESEELDESPTRVLPVNPNRIQASPMEAANSIDTVRPAQSVVSVFAGPTSPARS